MLVQVNESVTSRRHAFTPARTSDRDRPESHEANRLNPTFPWERCGRAATR